MSCGRSDETDCGEVLRQVYEYLDGEMGPEDCARISAHLRECGSCMSEYERDQLLKAIIRRSCRCESAPVALRTQILTRITTVTLETRTITRGD